MSSIGSEIEAGLYRQVLEVVVKEMNQGDNPATRAKALKKVADAHVKAVEVFEKCKPPLFQPLDPAANLPVGLRTLEEEIIGQRNADLSRNHLTEVARSYYEIGVGWPLAEKIVGITIFSIAEAK